MATQSGPIGNGLPYRQIALSIIEQETISSFSKDQRPSQPFIVDLVTLEKLFFQSIPTTIDYDPDSQFIAIESPGRNNPLYQYTGSEDTVEFNLSWFCNDESRMDVLLRCKWLEALTKNNNYDEPPHIVQLCFGDLFKDSKFIVAKAAYSLGRFNREFGMLPAYATQRVILKKVTDLNSTRSQILKRTT